MKKQVQLASTIDTSTGVKVLQKLGVCRVWMRLCLLLQESEPLMCEQQMARFLKLNPWGNEYQEGKD